MKKTQIILSILFVNWISSTNIFAQENAKNLFKYQDSINLHLFNYGIPMLEYPTQDIAPCIRNGNSPITITNPVTPDTANDWHSNESSGDDTNTTIYGKTDDNINIYWIHGLNGTTETWAIAAKATQFGIPAQNFPARKVQSVVGPSVGQTYSENLGITGAAQDMVGIASTYVNPSSHTDKDFIIAHSQGGIVAREWLRKMELEPYSYDNYAHGLVTFGTPHSGAEILNNTRPDLRNKLPNFFNDACNSLGDALVTPTINNNFWTRLLVSDDMKNTILTGACSFLSGSIIPFALDNYNKRTTLDYYVGSPFMAGENTPTGHEQGLSEYVLKVPVVQFYGVEEEPVLWRFMSSTMSIGEDKLSNKEIQFGYTKDDQLIVKVNDMINDFQAKYNYESNMFDYWNKKSCWGWAIAGSFISPFVGAAAAAACLYEKHTSMAAKIENMGAYGGAKNWLTNANDYYQTDIVGARVNVTKRICSVTRVLDCREPSRNGVGSGVPADKVVEQNQYDGTIGGCGGSHAVASYSNSYWYNGNLVHGTCSGYQEEITAYVNSYYYKANDGIVLAESAGAKIDVNTNLPGVTYDRIKLPLTNHDQMKNSTRTKLELTNLYEGNYGNFFKVGVK